MNFVDNAIDTGSGTIRARAEMSNTDLFITPGQFGRLRLPSSNEYEAILVPDSAILTDQSNRIVMTVADDGTVVPEPIRLGPTQPGGLRIVREGLKARKRSSSTALFAPGREPRSRREPGKIAPEATLTQN